MGPLFAHTSQNRPNKCFLQVGPVSFFYGHRETWDEGCSVAFHLLPHSKVPFNPTLFFELSLNYTRKITSLCAIKLPLKKGSSCFLSA